jgi:curved DNA-binding protein
VKIPAGIGDGKKLRLAGKGEPGPSGAPAGDLYLVVHVQPHSVFRREEKHLYLDKEIRFSEALLGTTIEVPTLLEETHKVRVPPGAQPGAKIRLKGKGMPGTGRGTPGDLYVTLRIAVPKKLNKRQKELAAELAEQGL